MKNAKKRVDAHQHAFWHYRDEVGLVEDMDQHGIDYAWLLTWEIHPTEHIAGSQYDRVLNPTRVGKDGSLEGIPLDDLIVAKRSHPERFVLGFCPHPLVGDSEARLRAAAGMYDIKVCGEWKFRIPFDDPRCIRLYRAAGELGMPVVLHLDVPFLSDGRGGERYDPAWYGGTVENLERALVACPETIFIGHAPGFWRELSADAATVPESCPSGPIEAPGKLQILFDRHANLWADLSAGSAFRALKRDSVYAKAFLESYADRLLFARDYYGGDLITLLDELELSDDALQNIAWKNAERLVRPPHASENRQKRPPLIRF